MSGGSQTGRQVWQGNPQGRLSGGSLVGRWVRQGGLQGRLGDGSHAGRQVEIGHQGCKLGNGTQKEIGARKVVTGGNYKGQKKQVPEVAGTPVYFHFFYQRSFVLSLAVSHLVIFSQFMLTTKQGGPMCMGQLAVRTSASVSITGCLTLCSALTPHQGSGGHPAHHSSASMPRQLQGQWAKLRAISGAGPNARNRGEIPLILNVKPKAPRNITILELCLLHGLSC